MRTKHAIVGGVLVLLIVGVGGYFLFPKQYPTVLLPKLSAEEHNARCTAHTGADTCEADAYCQSIELTPVCLQTAQGQNCLDGGYRCYPKSELTKKENNPYPKNVNCPDRKSQDHCQQTTDCGWSDNKCVYVNQERQDIE